MNLPAVVILLLNEHSFKFIHIYQVQTGNFRAVYLSWPSSFPSTLDV